MERVFGFVWEVPEDGFAWLKGKAVGEEKEAEYLVDKRPVGVSGMVTRYAPLKLYTGLFRTFAETSPTKDGILTFASKYGLLGDGQKFVPVDYKGDSTLAVGEPLSTWNKEIHAMRRALELWDAAREGDLNLLARRIAWKTGADGPSVLYDSHLGLDIHERPEPPYARETTWLATPNLHPELLERFRPGDLTAPALYYVQKAVNEHLKGRVSPRLLWDGRRTGLGLYIVPGSLIGAIWLQFAQAIDGRKEYRRCEECRTWFEVSPDTARTNRLYCSDACRARAYRKRRAEARRLAKEGLSVEQIAAQVGSDAETVRGWLS